MAPPVPDVWIRDLACPPGEVFGGQVVTRKLAASLPTLPCTRCFPTTTAATGTEGSDR